MVHSEGVCREKPCLLLFAELLWLWLLCCYGGSTVDYLGEDEERIVVVLFVVVVSAVFVWAVSSSVVGWIVMVVVIGVMGRAGCLSLLLVTSLTTEFHFAPSCAVVTQVVLLVSSLFCWIWLIVRKCRGSARFRFSHRRKVVFKLTSDDTGDQLSRVRIIQASLVALSRSFIRIGHRQSFRVEEFKIIVAFQQLDRIMSVLKFCHMEQIIAWSVWSLVHVHPW